MSIESKLAALIGSRICHDLISPIGAINNGLELLGMTGIAKSPELDLISESVGNASARIRFFRVAFGAASVQQVGASEVQNIIGDALGGGRISVRYLPTDAYERSSIRRVFLALLCLEHAMPYGGEIVIDCSDGTWSLKGTSEKANVEPALWSVLADPNLIDDIGPAQVQFAMLPMLAREEGLVLQTDLGETAIEIRF